MMIDCPLAIHHKKEEYICRGDFVVRGRFFMFWSCGAFRLYLCASFCIYIFGSSCIFVFDWVVHDKGRCYDVFIYVSCFTLLIDLYLGGYS